MTGDAKDRIGLATTFRKDEVELMSQLLQRLLMGGDMKQLLRNPAFASVAAKFTKLREKAARGGAS